MSDTKKPRRPQRVAKAIGIGLVILAVITELRKPQEARTWHGQVVGFVPYDLRMPTPARVRERLWAPENPRVLVPQVFGVGWTVNVGRVAALMRGRAAT